MNHDHLWEKRSQDFVSERFGDTVEIQECVICKARRIIATDSLTTFQ